MRFNKTTHKVEIETMSKREAREFIWFLNFESFRHTLDIILASLVGGATEIFRRRACVQFFNSEILRHWKDIDEIKKLKQVVIEMYKL